MAKEETPPSTLVDFFSSASYDDSTSRKAKRYSSKKVLAISAGFLLVATGALAAVTTLAPQNPHAKQIGSALLQWSEQSGGVEIPESGDYITYFSYLTNLGPRSADFGLPNFGDKSNDIMVKIVQEENAGSPFTVCSYDTSTPKQPVGIIEEYVYYSFSSETSEVKIDDPVCNPQGVR